MKSRLPFYALIGLFTLALDQAGHGQTNSAISTQPSAQTAQSPTPPLPQAVTAPQGKVSPPSGPIDLSTEPIVRVVANVLPAVVNINAQKTVPQYIAKYDQYFRLYREPVNLFVAGFLGSPPMNFVHGKLRESGDALIFKEVQDGVVEFKISDRPEAKPFAGREIIVGIRPEDIEIVTGTERPSGVRFQSLVDIVEHMGAEANVYLQTGAHTLICRTEAAIGTEEVGHRMQFEIDPARIHLFDPETTRRITA